MNNINILHNFSKNKISKKKKSFLKNITKTNLRNNFFETLTKNKKNYVQINDNIHNGIYYMNIDVKQGMCQGVHYKKVNNTIIAIKCKNKAKYLKNNMFELCEYHKYQNIAY